MVMIITPLPEKWIIEFGKHLDDLVRIAKEVGSYCNSDPGDEREVAHRELHRLYEGFCEWRHDKPYGTTDFSELLSQLLLQSYEQGKKDALTKAIELFDKYKDEPMVGRVVILELKAMRGDYDSKEEV